MADSNITKKALSSALKELMETVPFSKISVSDICGKCDMNRKSFYYHFKDKYDLINWTFNSEFIDEIGDNPDKSGWDIICDICKYFYNNKDFYRKALQIEGQNSFYRHFQNVLNAAVEQYMKKMFFECKNSEFYVTFYTDAFISSIVRWITDKDCIPPEEYTLCLKSCILDFANILVNNVK